MSYNEYLRDQLDRPIHYDRMIALIMQHNDACKNVDWACDVINICIRGALEKGDCATGMCFAVKLSPSSKVRLSLEPIGGSCVKEGNEIRKVNLPTENNYV